MKGRFCSRGLAFILFLHKTAVRTLHTRTFTELKNEGIKIDWDAWRLIRAVYATSVEHMLITIKLITIMLITIKVLWSGFSGLKMSNTNLADRDSHIQLTTRISSVHQKWLILLISVIFWTIKKPWFWNAGGQQALFLPNLTVLHHCAPNNLTLVKVCTLRGYPSLHGVLENLYFS